MKATLTIEVEIVPDKRHTPDEIMEHVEEKVRGVLEEQEFVSQYSTSFELDEG